MSKSTNGLRRSGLAALATTSLVTAAVLAGAGSAGAVEGFDLGRISGDNRYGTSAAVAEAFAETNETVILANGENDNYADALSANFLAGELGAPILLTRADVTPEETLAQLEADGVKNIILVGGATVISEEQEAELAKDYTVRRIEGENRFKTNAEIIGEGGNAEDGLGIIATGRKFADALASGPLSFQGHPVGLSEVDNIDDDVVAALKAAGVDEVLIAGGESAVGPEVVAELATEGITVRQRFDGEDRSHTSQLVADWALANMNFSDTYMYVATGDNRSFGVDALSGGPLAGKNTAPLLITRSIDNPDNVVDYAEAHADTLEGGDIFGGPNAVSPAAQTAIENAAQGEAPTSNQDYAVSPQEATTLTVATPDDASDDRQYTVGGLTAGTTYTVALVPAANVRTDADGNVTFKDSAGTNGEADDLGDAATAAAHISVVNGTSNNDDLATSQAVNGQITFTVDGDADGNVVPVVFQDADKDGALDVAPTGDWGAPTEAELFGVGGAINYNPGEAATGALDDGQSNDGGTTPDSATDDDQLITEVNEGADNFVTAQAMYEYDANDVFYVNDDAATDNDLEPAEQVTLADFEAALSTGDVLSEGTVYQRNAALQSTFVIDDIDPAAPTSISASDTTDNSTVITVNGVDDEASQVTVYCIVDPDDETTTNPGDADVENGTDTGATADNDVVTADAANVCASATADADADANGFQVNVTGLDPNTDYDMAATQTVDGEESNLSPELEVTTDPLDETGPVAQNVGPNDVNNGVGSTNQIRITFDEAVASLDAADVTVTSGSFTYNGVSATAANASGSVWLVTLDGTMQDAILTEEATYVLDLAEAAAVDTAGNESLEDADANGNATNDGEFTY